MPNGGELSHEAIEAFHPYERAIYEFAEAKGLEVEEFYHDSPIWIIGKRQSFYDLDVVWWNIQLGYGRGKLGLNAGARMDKEYNVPEGLVRERRLTSGKKCHIADWDVLENVDIGPLLSKAYDVATSFTEKDLNDVSATITGEDRVTRGYNLVSKS